METRLCGVCGEKEIFIKKRSLCKNCYYTAYREGLIAYDENANCEVENMAIFRERLVERYGQAIVNDYEAVRDKDKINLQSIADKYGFSREYARQTFKRLFGFDYTTCLKAKMSKRRERIIKTVHDPEKKLIRYKEGSLQYKGAIGEKLCLDICRAIGYEIAVCRESTPTIDLVINGFKCEVKTAYIPFGKQKTKHYRFTALPSQRNQADYFVCYIYPLNKFYVIPASEFQSLSIYIPEHIATSSKYFKYYSAWHVLRQANVRLYPASGANHG
jgi:hypothetical protein